jgi:hypothetical protein
MLPRTSGAEEGEPESPAKVRRRRTVRPGGEYRPGRVGGGIHRHGGEFTGVQGTHRRSERAGRRYRPGRVGGAFIYEGYPRPRAHGCAVVAPLRRVPRAPARPEVRPAAVEPATLFFVLFVLIRFYSHCIYFSLIRFQKFNPVFPGPWPSDTSYPWSSIPPTPRPAAPSSPRPGVRPARAPVRTTGERRHAAALAAVSRRQHAAASLTQLLRSPLHFRTCGSPRFSVRLSPTIWVYNRVEVETQRNIGRSK